MRRILIVLYLPIMLILSLPYMLIVYIISFISRDLKHKAAYAYARLYSQGILAIAGANIVVTGLEQLDPKENYLYVANHQSLLDPPTLMAILKDPVLFISKIEMKKVPIFSQWMQLLDSLFLNRKDNREGLKTILKGIEQLKGGDSLAIFPQGTRSDDHDFLPFKAGSFKLAFKSKRPIVPVMISGTSTVFEKNGLNLKPGTIHVEIMAPIPTHSLDMDEKKALPNEIESMIHQRFLAYLTK